MFIYPQCGITRVTEVPVYTLHTLQQEQESENPGKYDVFLQSDRKTSWCLSKFFEIDDLFFH